MNKLTYVNNQKNVIGKSLRRIRKKQKVTQLDLAARMQVLGVNVDQQAISNIENNKRIVTDYELACFCKALRCTEQELLQDFHDKLRTEE
ncbi:MAG: helix-turn-helix transcriptional regulator [Oscillibacter sp.]|nr:helix-turn-helix transcriptional regulator [Oscillibacter sp.]